MAIDSAKIQRSKDGTMSYYGKNIEDTDRSFDIIYWQTRSAQERFDSVWEMVVFAHELKKRDPDELRLDRSAQAYGRVRN